MNQLFGQIRKLILPQVALRLAAEKSLNKLLQLDAVTLRRLSELDGKVIKLQCIEPQLSVLIYFSSGKVSLLADHAGAAEKQSAEQQPPVNCSISATAPALFRLVFSGDDPQQVMHEENIIISGEASLLLILSRIIHDAEPDVEGWLAQYTGGFFAHSMGEVVRKGRKHTRYAARQTASAVKEWLQEESELVPPPIKFEQFRRDVSTFHMDVDRIEARIDHLSGKLK